MIYSAPSEGKEKRPDMESGRVNRVMSVVYFPQVHPPHEQFPHPQPSIAPYSFVCL